jgi:hypothetical protein
MSCPEYESIIDKEWSPALRAHDRLRDPSVIRQMSNKAIEEGRAREKSNLDRADARRNSHVAACRICKDEGRKPDFDSTASHHF